MKSNKFWLVLLGGLLLVSAGIGLLFAGKGGQVAVVTLNGEVIARVDLAKVDDFYNIEAKGRYHNTIEFDRGRVRVSSADCPDQVCVDTGWIEDGSKPIVCLPNRLVIEMTGESASADITAK